jgi:hypothetical protein
VVEEEKTAGAAIFKIVSLSTPHRASLDWSMDWTGQHEW